MDNMPIWIDNRGQGEEELYNILLSKHLAVERRYIESGDIVIGEIGIERKTIQDLINSVAGQNRHFWEQIEVLKNTYKIPIVIVEGTLNYTDRLVSGIVLMGLLLGWRVPYISTYNIYETADVVQRLFTCYGAKKAAGYPPAAVIKELTPERIRWAMIQCVRGVGPSMATKILKLVTFEELVSGNINWQWFAKSIKGMGPTTAKRVLGAFQ